MKWSSHYTHEYPRGMEVGKGSKGPDARIRLWTPEEVYMEGGSASPLSVLSSVPLPHPSTTERARWTGHQRQLVRLSSTSTEQREANLIIGAVSLQERGWLAAVAAGNAQEGCMLHQPGVPSEGWSQEAWQTQHSHAQGPTPQLQYHCSL